MSDTVKLIIEIPKDTAKEIKDNAMFAESIASQIKWDVTSAIVNGTPLDDVKAEIKELSESHCIQVMDREDIPLLALEIIDKYIGGEDE